MSIHAMNHVWRKSKAEGGTLLVMLAIADHADDDGKAFPSIAGLAAKARLQERQTHRAIKYLIKKGELRVEYKAGPKGKNLYTVILPGDKYPVTEDTVSILHPVIEDSVYPVTEDTVSPRPPESLVVSLKDKPPVSLKPLLTISSKSEDIVSAREIETIKEDGIDEQPKPATKEKKPRKSPQTPCPDFFVATEKHAAFAAEHGIDLPSELDHFLNHHRAKGSTFCDWSAALWTWLHNASKYKANGRGGYLSKQQQIEANNVAAGRAFLEDIRHQQGEEDRERIIG